MNSSINSHQSDQINIRNFFVSLNAFKKRFFRQFEFFTFRLANLLLKQGKDRNIEVESGSKAIFNGLNNNKQ